MGMEKRDRGVKSPRSLKGPRNFDAVVTRHRSSGVRAYTGG